MNTSHFSRLRRDDILALEDDKESGLVHYASMNNHPAFVYILTMLQQKDGEICLDDVNYYNQTPIVLACTYGHEDVLEVFLRYAPHVDLTDAIEVEIFRWFIVVDVIKNYTWKPR